MGGCGLFGRGRKRGEGKERGKEEEIGRRERGERGRGEEGSCIKREGHTTATSITCKLFVA